MPLHYVEIGKLLLQQLRHPVCVLLVRVFRSGQLTHSPSPAAYSAPEDVNEFTEVQSLLEDIQEIRLAKIFSQLKKLSGPFAILEVQQ